jgi:hypothetical protein
MKAAIEKLSKVGQELYAKAAEAAQAAGVDPAAAAAAGAGAGGGEPPPKKEKKVDNVVDADFEVVDDDEKKS